VVIEIAQGSSVKYEVDEKNGALMVDRFLFAPMIYPAAYGFIPNTLSGDGEPADALVLLPAQVVPGAVLRARPIGVLFMEDESGKDEKIICLPHDEVYPQFKGNTELSSLPKITIKVIEHFFTHYKDLEPGKWVKIVGWGGRLAAEAAIEAGMKAFAAN